MRAYVTPAYTGEKRPTWLLFGQSHYLIRPMAEKEFGGPSHRSIRKGLAASRKVKGIAR